jgi:hypothetical protein
MNPRDYALRVIALGLIVLGIGFGVWAAFQLDSWAVY